MSQKLANKTDAKSRKDLPPPREDKAIRTDVPAPLTNTSLTTVIYYISAALLLYFAYYAYLMTQWKDEYGGWVNFALGRTPPPAPRNDAFGLGTQYTQKPEPAGKLLENRIKELANQLGIEPTEFASAIKTLVHPTKVSALDKDPEATGGLVGVLTEDAKERAKAQEGMGEPLSWIDTAVGLDEPPSEPV